MRRVLIGNIVGVFLEDGAVCTYYNFETHGKQYESGDIVELPRTDHLATVVILGIHENLGKAAEAATHYFKRICRWDAVDLKDVNLFGHSLAPIEEQVSQIALFESQGIEGPLLVGANVYNMMSLSTQDSQEDA